MFKNIDAAEHWAVFDTERGTYNPTDHRLLPNSADTEQANNDLDILSNGFKWRTSTNDNKTNTYIYYAIAETPFKYANAR